MFPVVFDEVNTTLPPEQNVNGPLAEIVGADGAASTVTVTGCELSEKQPLALAYETE